MEKKEREKLIDILVDSLEIGHWAVICKLMSEQKHFWPLENKGDKRQLLEDLFDAWDLALE